MSRILSTSSMMMFGALLLTGGASAIYWEQNLTNQWILLG